MWNKKLKTALLMTASLVGVLAFTSPTKANSIEVAGVTTTLTAGVWDYAYAMTLSANNSISATNPNGNSMFIFYDVSGLTASKATFTAGTTAVTDWNIVIEKTTANWAAGQSSIVSQGGTAVENDLAAIDNARFQYVGAGLASGADDSAIGTAHLFSTAPPGLYGQFAARWIGISGNTQVNTQTPIMPVIAGVGAVSAPMPSAVWTGLASMIALAVFARSRRRSY